MRQKLILSAALLVLGIGFFQMWQSYTAGPRDLSSTKVEIRILASELFDHFSMNEPDAEEKFLDKIIAVQGEVSGIQIQENGLSTIELATNDILGVVSCEMADVLEIPEPGQSILIKGQCTGYLSDVVLVKCIQIK